MTSFTGTSGNDTLTGTAGNDTFNVSQGGDDTVSGAGGNDVINFGTAFTAADSVDGGAGSDKVILDGNYSARVTLGATSLVNVEQIQFDAGNDYTLRTVDQTVAAGQTLTLNGAALGAGDILSFDGRAETDGRFHIIGGAGDDRLFGGAKNDLIDVSGGGNDFVQAANGNDTIVLGAAFTASDQISGGSGYDIADITLGNAESVIAFNATTMQSVEDVVFGASSQSVAWGLIDATIAAGASMKIDAHALTGSLDITDLSETNGNLYVVGSQGTNNLASGAGNDVLTGGPGTDFFDISSGGEDVIYGGGGTDSFNAGSALNSGDHIEGDDVNDTLTLNGNYPTQVDLSSNLIGIHKMVLEGFAFNLKIGGMTEHDSIDASSSSQINLDLTPMAGNAAAVQGGHGNDVVITADNHIHFNGSTGDDTLILTGVNPPSSDAMHFNGAAGFNTLELDGDIGMSVAGMGNVQLILCEPGHDYTVGLSGTDLTADPDLVLDGHLLGASDTLFASEASLGYAFKTIIGGAGDDTLYTGGTVTGGGGADHIWGSEGETIEDDWVPTGGNTFVYNAVSDSTGANYNSLFRVLTSNDTFKLWFAVTGVDATVASGALSTATFDTDLSAAIGSSQLAAGHAVLFTPDTGTLHGDAFLVIDANGTAGYQAEQDLVIMVSIADTGAFTTANFTT